MGKVLWLTFSSSLTDLCEKNSSFDSAKLRICYTGENRNGSFIPKEVIEKNIESIYNCPVVCRYDRESDSIGGHDIEFVKDDEGNMSIVNNTQPVGVIPESANIWFENIQEDDGSIHEYLCADALIWKRQEAYSKIKRDGITAQSMEINVDQGEQRDGIYHIDKFEFTAFTLLGDCEPCFESASLELFSKNDFKRQLSEMMNDLKEELKLADSPKGDSNKLLQEYSTEGGGKVLEDNLNLSDQIETEMEFSEEVTESEAITESESVDDDSTTDETASDISAEENFGLQGQLWDEIDRVVSTEKIKNRWDEDVCHYRLYDFDADAGEVYAWDFCDGNLYGFAYSMDGDAVVIDWASKKRMKIVVAEFEGGEAPEQPAPMAPAFELTDRIMQNYSDIKSKFDAAAAQIATMEAELGTLRAFKKDYDEEIAKNKCEEILSRFEDLNGVEAFEALRAGAMAYDLDTLEEKCFALRGRNNSVQKFSAEKTTTKVKVERPNDVSDEPYGGLFLQYTRG